MDVRSKKPEPVAQSEDQEDELLSIVAIKGYVAILSSQTSRAVASSVMLLMEHCTTSTTVAIASRQISAALR